MSFYGNDSGQDFSSVFGNAADDLKFDEVISAEEDDFLMEAVEDHLFGDSQGEDDKTVCDLKGELTSDDYDNDIDSGLDIDDDTGLDIELGSYTDSYADDDLEDIEGATSKAAKYGADQYNTGDLSESGIEFDDDDDFELDGDFDLDEYPYIKEGAEEDDEAEDDIDNGTDEDSVEECGDIGSNSDDVLDDDDFTIESYIFEGDEEDLDDDSDDDDNLEAETEAYLMAVGEDGDCDESDDYDDDDISVDEATDDSMEDDDIKAIENDSDGELSDAELAELLNVGGDDEIIDDLEGE